MKYFRASSKISYVCLGSEVPMEHVLGLHWNTVEDTFVFKLKFNKIDPKLLNGDLRPTKRDELKSTDVNLRSDGFFGTSHH